MHMYTSPCFNLFTWETEVMANMYVNYSIQSLGIALALVQQEYFCAISPLSVHQPVLPLMISF